MKISQFISNFPLFITLQTDLCMNGKLPEVQFSHNEGYMFQNLKMRCRVKQGVVTLLPTLVELAL